MNIMNKNNLKMYESPVVEVINATLEVELMSGSATFEKPEFARESDVDFETEN